MNGDMFVDGEEVFFSPLAARLYPAIGVSLVSTYRRASKPGNGSIGLSGGSVLP